jgi:adenine-specific DNA-methyltransferase
VGRVRRLKDPTPVARARSLRRDDTVAEARLWAALRDRRLGGFKWRRQVPRGAYILDFYCADARLVVELDGGQHSEAVRYDERRTAWLEAQGLQVLRFWNHQILTSFGRRLPFDPERLRGQGLNPLPARGERAG